MPDPPAVRPPLEVVAGLSLKNLHPRVWDSASPFYLPALGAVMVSYAEFRRSPPRRRRAAAGLRAYLGAPPGVRIYLDNGAFSLMRSADGLPTAAEARRRAADFDAFARAARPDWHPVPADYIPTPDLSPWARGGRVTRTLNQLRRSTGGPHVPVVHVGPHLPRYLNELRKMPRVLCDRATPCLAVGGIVPNLLRAPKALGYPTVLANLRDVRAAFPGKKLHVFGVGGTATVHLAAVLGFDSADSSGWRNRAARGLIQLPGTGDRLLAKMGSWRGRGLSPAERDRLAACRCPGCREASEHDAEPLAGLAARGLAGFCRRATHNLHVLLEEAAWVDARLRTGTYAAEWPGRLDNSVYRPLIEAALAG